MSNNYKMVSPQQALKIYQDRLNDWAGGLPSSIWKEMNREFTKAWADLSAQMLNDPQKWSEKIFDYHHQQTNLWLGLFSGQGVSGSSEIGSKPGDRRFRAKDWHDNPMFDYIRQSYLLSSEAIYMCAEETTLDENNKQKLRFYTRQMVDAMSPTNFLLTNPEVIQQAIDSKGQSLIDGMNNLLGDLEKGRISMTDETAFRLGENIATSKGYVVFENELFQLIQYEPLTKKVSTRPLVIIPPFINKFYILDLQPENSFVNYCLEQGNSVFIVSWANPDADKSDLCWDDYIEQGVLKAFNIVKEIRQTRKLNAVAWCVGGTLLATTLAVLAARKDKTVASATFFTTLLDFSEPGELGIFIDEEQVADREKYVEKAGMLSGKDLSLLFSMLRSNDLIWSYVVNNYLKGRQPVPFDILYWNSDPTNLPANMYVSYIQNMYMENKLVQPDVLEFCGEKIDLSKIKTPSYFLCAVEDHIAPWKATFKTRNLFSGEVEFVLGASGHIAGVINPASKNKRHYWVNGNETNDADHWLETAERKQGSWWPNWDQWLKAQGGSDTVAPKKPGNKAYPVIEPAPGRYVKKRN